MPFNKNVVCFLLGVYRYNLSVFTISHNLQIYLLKTKERYGELFQCHCELRVKIQNYNDARSAKCSGKKEVKYSQMLKKAKYNSSWEREFEWLKPSKMSEYYALCTFCKQYFKIDGTGRTQVLHHFRSQKHCQIEQRHRRPHSLKTVLSPNSKTSKLSKDEELINAEIIWTLKIIDTNCSYNTSDNYCAIFKLMFPDSIVARNIDLGRTKMKYLAQFGIAPYIEKLVKTEMQGSPFSFLFVETASNLQAKKQFDCYIQYWSNTEDKFVPAIYCGSIFVGHCRADILKTHFFAFVKKLNLDCSLLMHIGIDGPNPNLKFHRILMKELDESHFTSLLDIGICNVHPVYGGFKKGLSHINFHYESFMNDLIFFLKLSWGNREDDKVLEIVVEVCLKFFSCHTSIKWLSLKPALVKILEYYTHIKDYFLTFLPKHENFKREIETTIKFKCITKMLRDRKTLIYINFIIHTASIFESFLVRFQKQEPSLHLWHDGLSKLLFDLMSNFLKHNVLFHKGKKLEGETLSQIDCRNRSLQLQNVILNSNTKREIDLSSLNVKAVAEIRNEFLQFYVEAVSFLQKKLPLNSAFLKDISHLQQSNKDVEAITRVCKTIVNVIKNENVLNRLFHTQGKDKNSLCDIVIHQAKLFALEKETHQDIFQDYWKHIGQITDSLGEKKYLQLYILVKCVMVLTHGNLAPERGFLINKRVLEKNKSASDEETICTIRIIKDYLNHIGGIEHFVINRELIKTVKNSQKKYTDFMDKKKKRIKR